MQLDRLAVDLRPRTPWEALDLGAAMLREWWTPILRVWAATFVPWVLLLGAVGYARPWLCVLLLWWTKPVFDRFVLHVASRAVFGETPSVRATLAAWREILTPGLLRSLTLSRFSGARSFHLPVAQLERQTGRESRDRRRVLDRRAAGTAYWLTIVCAHLEAVLMLSFGALLALLSPLDPGETSGGIGALFVGEGGGGFSRLDAAFYALAVTIVEPLYVSSGLALYLNRRTQLEGWDIELAFRRMESRINPRGTRVLAALLAACLAAAAATWQGEAHAATSRDTVQKAADDVLKAPEFEEYKVEKVWRRKGGDKPPPPGTTPPWLQDLLRIIGEAGRILAWVLAAFGVAALLWLAFRLSKSRGEVKRPAPRAPTVLFGMDIRPESLPDDPGAAARSLALAGRVRDALSLLYRASLATLVHEHGLELHEGATEGDALRAGRAALGPAPGQYLGSLVATWQAVAYAAREPDAQAAVRLADDWTEHFGRRVAGAAA